MKTHPLNTSHIVVEIQNPDTSHIKSETQVFCTSQDQYESHESYTSQ